VGMIDIAEKPLIERKAVAQGRIFLKPVTLTAIHDRKIKKGDPLQAGELVALSAVKRTPDLLPHCHPIPIDHVEVTYEFIEEHILVTVTVKSTARTGVEMEALMGVTMALNTIWDMVKYLEKDQKGQYPDTKICDVKIIKKTKGENV